MTRDGRTHRPRGPSRTGCADWEADRNQTGRVFNRFDFILMIPGRRRNVGAREHVSGLRDSTEALRCAGRTSGDALGAKGDPRESAHPARPAQLRDRERPARRRPAEVEDAAAVARRGGEPPTRVLTERQGGDPVGSSRLQRERGRCRKAARRSHVKDADEIRCASYRDE